MHQTTAAGFGSCCYCLLSFMDTRPTLLLLPCPAKPPTASCSRDRFSFNLPGRLPHPLLPLPPHMQVSYCILAGIGVTSILVFWMVSLHRSRERQRRLARAKRAFTHRWHSVTSSLGLAASAVAAFKAKGAAGAAAGRSKGGGNGNGTAVQGSAPSVPSTRSAQGGVKGGAPRLRSRLQSSRVSWGSDVAKAANAAAGGAEPAPPGTTSGGSSGAEAGAMPASPFERAATGAAASKWQAAAGAAAQQAPALAGADSHVGSGVQLLPAQAPSSAAQPRTLETANTISGPQGGGGSHMAGSSSFSGLRGGCP